MRAARLLFLAVAVAATGVAVALRVSAPGDDPIQASPWTPPSSAPDAPTSTSTSTAATSTTPTPSTTAPLPQVAPEIAALADRTTMTDEARRAFYVAEPQLVDKTQLAAACPLRQEVSVLGCFGGGRITVLVVDDPRLDGMMETTAAHEMLHAVWVLLSPAERADLAAELQAEYDGSDDSDLEEKVESYRQADPTVVDNELHSILGTEVADLSAELEAYYARWFIDRSQVAALADASQTTFDALEEQVAALDAQLNTLRAEIEDENARLDAEAAALDTFRADLDRLAAEERIDEYNAAVPDFNTRVDAYNVAAGNLQVQIDNYNALVEQRNQLAAEWEQLTEPINTSLGDVSAQPAA